MEGDAVATFQPPEPQGNGRPQAPPPDPGADPVGVPLSVGYRPSAPWQWFWTRDGLPRPPVLYDLEEMLRHPRVKTALNFFRGALAGATVRVTRASSPAVLAYAQAELDRFWQRGRPDAQRADEYGWLGAEVCYARKEGRVVFDRLLPFHPNDTRVLLRDHLYAGVRVTGVPDRPQLDLWGPGGNCLAKAFWAAHRPRFDRWYGQSQLAGAHRPFRRLAGRDCLEDVIDGGLYRYGVGGPIVKFPRGAPEVENQVQGSPKRRKNSDVAADIIEKMKAGSGYGIPSGTHPGTNEPLWGVEAFNPELDIAGLLEAERRLGELIALGIDVPPEVIEAGDTGTGYSGRAIPLESFLAGKTDDANALLRAWQWQIGEPLARWNFGPESWFEAEVEPLLQSHRAQAGGQAPPGEPPTPPGQPPRGPGQPPGRTPDGRPSSQLGLALNPEGEGHAGDAEGQEDQEGDEEAVRGEEGRAGVPRLGQQGDHQGGPQEGQAQDLSTLSVRREYARDELGRFATRARQALARHPDPGPAPPLPPGALRPGAAADLGVAATLAAHHEHAQAYHRHVAAHNVYRALAGSAPPPVPPRPDLPPRRQAKLFHKAVERYGEEEFLAGRVHGPYAAAVHADDPGLLDVAKGAAAGRHAAALAQAAAHARSLAAALPEPVHRPMQPADLSAGHLIDAGAVHEGLRPAVEGLAAKLPHAEHESGLRLALPSTPEASATLRALSELGTASRLKDDPDAKREVLERLGPEGVKKLRDGGLSTLEVRHAPRGGAAAKGRQYKGGQFEPSDATAKGAPEEGREEEGGESEGEKFDLPPPPPKKDVKLGGEKFGPSKATASVTTSADRAAAKDLVVKLFGGTSAEAYQALASSVGAPDDAEVVVESVGKYDGLYSDDLPLNAVGVRVTIKHPKLAEASRFVGVDDQGRRFIKNEILRVKSEYQNEGLGADIFARQVEQAATNGFDDIRTHAAGKPGSAFNGYYTWPRFGYDMSLTDPDGVGSGWDARVYVQARQRFPGAKTVLDVMATREGRDWWKQNGRDMYNAKFDLSEGSRSMKVLSAYLEERRSKKAEG